VNASTRADAILGFLARLPEVEPLIRSVLPRASATARVEVRSGGRARARSVLLDLGARPLRVTREVAAAGAAVTIAGEAEDLHAIFSGELDAGRAFGERRLLLRGSALQLGRFLPLLELAPLLYRHTEAVMEPPAPRRPVEAQLQSFAERLAFVAGFAFARARGLLPGLDLFPIARALGRGLAAGEARPPAPGAPR
jgi:hypothetical protein